MRYRGYGGNIGHDPHILYTLSAVQIMVMLNLEDQLNTSAICSFVSSLQNKVTGAFRGDMYGEEDTRFSYCAVRFAINTPKKRTFVIVIVIVFILTIAL